MSSSVAPDVFLVEHARNCEIFGFAKKLWPNVLCVCDSHNVESNLLQQILPQGSGKAAMVHAIERYEVHALNRSDLLWTCSQADLDKYRSLGVRAKAVGVLPNGVDTAKIPFTEAQDACGNILFVGNLAYQPNIQGVLWFINNVWPRVKTHLPNAIFQIVGAWPSGEILKFAGDDIKVASDVPSVRPFFESAALAICPLFSGSGTRLKIVEAFSAGIPMVSTSVGAEGLEFEEGVHLFIRNNAEDFAAAIIRLIANPPEREAMRRAARALAEQKYDWKVISASASEQIMSLLP